MRPQLNNVDQKPLRIAIATDAWSPQVNGVVTTLGKTIEELKTAGHTVLTLAPDPTKRSIIVQENLRVELFPWRRIPRQLKAFKPDCIHIATEGTIGLAARSYCIWHGKPFSTAFHTRYDQYVVARFGEAAREVASGYLRWFHAPSSAVMATTPSMRDDLKDMGLRRVVVWARGVDAGRFRSQAEGDADPFASYKNQGLLVVGLHSRVDPEKNLPAFLDLDLPDAKKVVIGDGKSLAELRARYPDVLFTGKKMGDELVQHVNALDVFVFPSKSDTYGLVLTEAAACGVPVAAFPVTGPIDVFGKYPVPGPGENPERAECRAFVRLNADLGTAVREVMEMVRADKAGIAKAATSFATALTWKAATDIFTRNLQEDTPQRRRRLMRIVNIISFIPYLPPPRKRQDSLSQRKRVPTPHS